MPATRTTPPTIEHSKYTDVVGAGNLLSRRILPGKGADFLKQIDSAITRARATVTTLER